MVNTFGLLARPGYGARSKNYAWYGTNIVASADHTNFYSSASSQA